MKTLDQITTIQPTTPMKTELGKAIGEAVRPEQGKRTRAKRKADRNAMFQERESRKAEFIRKHPILSGAVKVVDYVPPYSGVGK